MHGEPHRELLPPCLAERGSIQVCTLSNTKKQSSTVATTLRPVNKNGDAREDTAGVVAASRGIAPGRAVFFVGVGSMHMLLRVTPLACLGGRAISMAGPQCTEVARQAV